MNISLNWLTDYVDVTLPAKELGDLFTRIGVPCDGIEETATDILFDLEVTSNRPDLLGHLGMARELAAATGAEFRPPQIPDLPTEGKAAELTSVEVWDPDLCPRYTARLLRGVKVGPSPKWLIERLEAVGLRSINNVVDVTNYVLFEYSQPLHSFDFDKLAERRIIVRRGKGGEQIVSIDETKCTLDDRMCVIADAERPVAIAGIMGGLNTEVTAETTNVLIEAAQFDPMTTRKTSRRLGILSESNYRFERGVDPVAVDEASLRACQLILDLAGGTLAEGVVDVWAKPYAAPQVAMRPARCSTLVGIDIPTERQTEILAALGLSPTLDGGRIVCTIPSHRGDLRREADLIEEVARLEGYDQIPLRHEVTHELLPPATEEVSRKRMARALAAAGFDEAVTFSFVDAEEARLFGHERHVTVDANVRKTNNVLRPTGVPSLLKACKANQDVGNAEVSLWELAAVFPAAGAAGPGALPDERRDVTLVSTRGLRVLRGAVETMVSAVAPHASLEIRPQPVPGLDGSAGGELVLGGQAVGVIGVVAGDVQHHCGLERPAAAATIAYDALLAAAETARTYEPLPRFPAVRRDLSVVMDEDVTYGQLLSAVESVAQPLRVGVEYVTTYRGKQAGKGRKSMTITLVYRSDEGTLRGEQVDEQVGAICDALKAELRASFRG